MAAVFQEKEHLDESTPRTKGDIIGFSDTEDSESDDESIDVTDIQPNVSRDMKNTNIETNLCFSWVMDELLRQQGTGRGGYTILTNILA